MKIEVFIVEDVFTLAEQLRDGLEKRGFAVVGCASTGEQAIEAIIKTHPDIVIMDVNLEGALDGIQTTQALHERFDVPVIYLTSMLDDDTRKRAKTSRPFAFLSKPVSFPQLQAAIDVSLYRHHLEVELKEKEKELSNYREGRLHELIQGQDMERERVARELHDGLGQMLSAVKINYDHLISIENLDSEHSSLLNGIISDTVEEVSRISENLMPLGLMALDIQSCTEALLKSLCNARNIQFTIHSDDFPVFEDHATKLHVYRMIQEVVNNAIKHSECSRLLLSFLGIKKGWMISIQDDGIGFDVSRDDLYKRNGQLCRGLNNLHERAVMIGAQLKIISKKKKGTTVQFLKL